ncbi:ATP-binding protein [Anaerovibrio sp.]|uniref:sensor histidine kinase n=1 Tax=Anaerovibrio sp. TaxID=1872532 RepID=UPI0026283B3D|nr:ATP-binding protein [Anaerovibrio sp.]MDD6596761.1 ATP-binding protein [Anaerovibrio sp.]MDD7677165.1 ATP-binding protein [Anaerovibrio sp.]MDY2602982.1 ATP-binding protein [Anaerovibrio sp.]MDY4883783.1 ATP-binding protein [Anaerovibrio sp.]
MHRYLGIVGGALMAFILATGLIMGTMFTYFSDIQRQQLKTETGMAALAVDELQAGYLEKLPAENYRVTWISAAGNVLYDSDMAASQMENHLEREEVQAALRRGYGESQRYSGTMTVKMLYSAQRLADGSVLRLSMPQHTMLMVIWDMALPIGVILLVVIGASVALAARETKKANQEETEAMRREFTANVSHELKTPLHSISGFAELLKNGMVMEQDTGYFAEKIYNEAQRMIKLVQDIIILSRLDEGQENTTKSAVNLYQLAEGVIANLEPMADKQGITMELIGQPVVMDGIPHLLNSMLFNICENAIKYNKPEGSVLVEVSEISGHPRITVRDSGIGIPMRDRHRIFERFYRVDKSHSKEVGGTGLGLSIVKHAARLHNAKLEVDSIVGEGTLITVKF